MDNTKENLKDKLSFLLASKKTMVDYMDLKMHEEDWHGVSDAANDLRELEIEILYVKEAMQQM